MKVSFDTKTINKYIPKMTTTTCMKNKRAIPKSNLDVS